MKKKIYIAGKLTGITETEVLKNLTIFQKKI